MGTQVSARLILKFLADIIHCHCDQRLVIGFRDNRQFYVLCQQTCRQAMELFKRISSAKILMLGTHHLYSKRQKLMVRAGTLSAGISEKLHNDSLESWNR